MKIELTEENVLLAGRTYKEGDTLWLALSGTGASFIYTGKKLFITVVGSPVINHEDAENNCVRIAVYVNGERKVDDMVTQAEQTYTVWESDVAETVEVKIIKLSESAMSVVGVKDLEIAEGERVVPAAKKEHLIEFIGDSITCGYGVDDEDPLHPFSTKTEDVTRAYAYLTAQLLSCDCRMFSASGYGIISGYTADPEIKSAEQLIPLYYSSYGFSYDTFPGGKKPMDIPWDFTEKQPDIIVINLGTNDDSYCQETEWKNTGINMQSFFWMSGRKIPERKFFAYWDLWAQDFIHVSVRHAISTGKKRGMKRFIPWNCRNRTGKRDM